MIYREEVYIYIIVERNHGGRRNLDCEGGAAAAGRRSVRV
jgi:hypothetical protein